jgi:GNAT superfamily N-acetyltransferase
VKIFTKKLDKSLWPDFEAFFEFKGQCSGCWCMNHRLPMGLDFGGEAAKLAMKELVESNRVFGVLAYLEGDDIPIGWASLDKRKTLPGQDCIGDNINCPSEIWSIHCVTVRQDMKRKGIESFLINSAVELAKELKATSIESYPEPNSVEGQEFKTWNSFNGYENLYKKIGFVALTKVNADQKEFYRPMKKDLD